MFTLQERRSLKKKSIESTFDETMGSYHGADIYELVGFRIDLNGEFIKSLQKTER